ncbi:MAG TPA: hypothetical protein PLV45_05635 [bacterium]|nr:hypothetical protein [bacterium]
MKIRSGMPADIRFQMWNRMQSTTWMGVRGMELSRTSGSRQALITTLCRKAAHFADPELRIPLKKDFHIMIRGFGSARLNIIAMPNHLQMTLTCSSAGTRFLKSNLWKMEWEVGKCVAVPVRIVIREGHGDRRKHY